MAWAERTLGRQLGGYAFRCFPHVLMHSCGTAPRPVTWAETAIGLLIFFLFLLMAPLVTGLATLKCHQKQGFQRLLGG